MAKERFCPFMSTASEKVNCDKEKCGAVQTVFDPNMHVGITSCHPAGAIVDSAVLLGNRIDDLIEALTGVETGKV